APKLPSPLPSTTETVFELPLATARSGLPSPFRSPIATELGPLPVPKSVFAPKLPSPLPSSAETVLAKLFATAKSGLPSPFTSPIATETAPSPVLNERNGAAKRGAATARGTVLPEPTASKSAWTNRRRRVDLGLGMADLQSWSPYGV